jgi:hypothetical protein
VFAKVGKYVTALCMIMCIAAADVPSFLQASDWDVYGDCVCMEMSSSELVTPISEWRATGQNMCLVPQSYAGTCAWRLLRCLLLAGTCLECVE